MRAGESIRQSCISLEERPQLEGAYQRWLAASLAYLNSIDAGFAQTLNSAGGYSFATAITVGQESKNIPKVNQAVLVSITYKLESLSKILQEIPVS
jgi:hypothetical protein